MTSTALPPLFVLSIPSRKKSADPYAGYVLIDAIKAHDGASYLLSPAASIPNSSQPYTLCEPPALIAMGSNVSFSKQPAVGFQLVNVKTNTVQTAVMFRYSTLSVIPPGGGLPLPVLGFSHEKLTDFLPFGLRRNIHIVAQQAKPATPAPVASPVLQSSADAISLITDAAASVSKAVALLQQQKKESAPSALVSIPSAMSSVLAPLLVPAGGAGLSPPPVAPPATDAAATAPTKSKKTKPIPKKYSPPPLPQPKGDLSVHVAQQLFQLARINKTECPIIAEELSEGNTAAMPCGHLFSRMAIEESFKKELRKCPACRATGTPTYV